MAAANKFDEKLAEIASSGETPALLLHCCCAPCASYVLELLSPFFQITALYFNPNIMPREEHDKREAELTRLLRAAEYPNSVKLMRIDYAPERFEEAVVPYRQAPEGGMRCRACFFLRLGETAKRAAGMGFDYFTTTLSVSPHKDSKLLDEVCYELSAEYGVNYLQSNFKKRNGYKRSAELSRQYGLYRQAYCGCIYAATPKAGL